MTMYAGYDVVMIPALPQNTNRDNAAEDLLTTPGTESIPTVVPVLIIRCLWWAV